MTRSEPSYLCIFEQVRPGLKQNTLVAASSSPSEGFGSSSSIHYSRTEKNFALKVLIQNNASIWTIPLPVRKPYLSYFFFLALQIFYSLAVVELITVVTMLHSVLPEIY